LSCSRRWSMIPVKPARKIKIETLREMIEPRHGYRITTVDPVIVREGKVLLQKRSFGMFRGCWVLPGGRVEAGEDTWRACVREAREETGLDVSIVRMIGFYDDPGRDPEKHAVSMAFLCRPVKGRPRKSGEATEIKWFPISQLPGKMGFDHARIIADARRLLGKQNPIRQAFKPDSVAH
jgi:8-oxo-dGTP diphosphatase